MCYNIEALKKTQLKKATHLVNMDSLNWNELKDYHLVSGFDHPQLILHNKDQEGVIASWGLIPHFANLDQADFYANKTLNARVETLFEKKSFAPYAVEQRAVFYIDSFYDYHHVGKEKCAIRISSHEGNPLLIGAVFTRQNQATFSMITQVAQGQMELVHNKHPESRMPLVIDPADLDLFYHANKDQLIEFCAKPKKYDFHLQSVAPLSGAKSLGNNVLQKKDYNYPKLNLTHLGISGSQLSLF